MMKMLRYLVELGTALLILVAFVILCAALLPFDPPKVCRLTGDAGPYPPWRCGEPSGW